MRKGALIARRVYPKALSCVDPSPGKLRPPLLLSWRLPVIGTDKQHNVTQIVPEAVLAAGDYASHWSRARSRDKQPPRPLKCESVLPLWERTSPQSACGVIVPVVEIHFRRAVAASADSSLSVAGIRFRGALWCPIRDINGLSIALLFPRPGVASANAVTSTSTQAQIILRQTV